MELYMQHLDFLLSLFQQAKVNIIHELTPIQSSPSTPKPTPQTGSQCY